MNAQSEVFNTTELLESILLQLPPRRILVPQAVCQQFRNVIARSVVIRQKLFLEPDYLAETRHNDLIPFTRSTIQISLGPTEADRYFRQRQGSTIIEEPYVHGNMYIYNINKSPDGSWMTEPVGSWRDMLPCQPPPAMVLLGIPQMPKRDPAILLGDGEMVTLGQIERITKTFWDEKFWEEENREVATFKAYGPQLRHWKVNMQPMRLYVVGKEVQPFEDFVRMMKQPFYEFSGMNCGGEH